MIVEVPENPEPYPEASLRDYARTGADAAMAAIPLVGGSLQVLVDAVLAPSLSRRRERWFETLGRLMLELQERVDGFDVSALAGDEVFVTAVIDASRIAMGTHLEQKLEMLKNCLAHMAIEQPRDDFLDLQLFRFVDALTPQHFILLQYLENPGAWFDAKGIERPKFASMGSPGHLLDAAGLPVAGTALEIVLRDLNDRGLAATGSLGTTMTASGAWQRLATDLGSELLNFVTSV